MKGVLHAAAAAGTRELSCFGLIRLKIKQSNPDFQTKKYRWDWQQRYNEA